LILAKKYKFNVLAIPNFEDLLSGSYLISDIKPVQIYDLLRRKPASFNKKILSSTIINKNILVTGAGGSIGSEIVIQLIKYNPKNIICYDFSEFNLYKLKQSLSKYCKSSDIKIHFILGDIKDLSRLKKIFIRTKIHQIYHAAAYKHVPLNEQDNIDNVLENNVLGTYNLVSLASEFNVTKFIFISTDKAVNPTNIMGASKRLAEVITQKIQDTSNTVFITVRFGNVLGSSGSVIPLFKSQIDNGGPVTVTDPDITRYFMLVEEAAILVLESAVIGKSGQILHLDMGDPIRIFDLAKDMIRLSGFEENDIKIVFTGLRKGEKIHEELLAHDENTIETSNEKIRVANISHTEKFSIEELLVWIRSLNKKSDSKIKKELKKFVKTYKSIS